MTPQKDGAKNFFAKWQKQIFLFFAIGCLTGAALFIYVGYSLFHEKTVLFGVFMLYVFILTGIVLYFGRRLIAMIGE
jgi:hypothetical protein